MSNNKEFIKRRSFLKLGVTGLAGATMLPSALTAKNSSRSQEKNESKFIYRTLGKTGIKLPVVSMGVMNADNPNLVAAALDAGIVMLDTAWGYQRGNNEKMIGEVIKDRPRDSFVIATKVPGMPRDRRTGLFTSETKGETFIEMFHTSLERLGLDYVEILYLHGVSQREAVMFEPLMEALQQVKKKGKARFIGITTHRNEPEAIRAAIEAKIYDVVLTAYNFRKENLNDLDAAIAQAAKEGLGIVAMKTQAGVYWDEEKQKPINMKAALKWALNNPNIHTAIPGFTTFDQLELDLTVMEDLTLTEEEKKDLIQGDNLHTSLYCQQCERCMPQCPARLPIPSIMRGYMYAYGYRNLYAAHDLISSLELPDNPCQSCSSCSVKCASGFNVKKRIEDISRIKSIPLDFFV